MLPTSAPPPPALSYGAAVRRPSYNYVLALMLLLLYEGSVLAMQWVGRGQAINGVDALFNYLLAFIPYGTWLISGAIAVVGLALIYQDNKEGIPLRRNHLLLMLLESAVWAVALFLFLPMFVSKVFLQPNLLLQVAGPEAAPAVAKPTWIENVGLSFGAGFYEEFFFRLLLVRGLQLLLSLFGIKQTAVLPTAFVLVTASVLFSLAHYVGTLGDSFNWYSFLYRFLFGMLMSLLLVWRRFGITAWTHALYDVLVFSAMAFR